MRVSSTFRKWFAGLALFAIVASGLGIAGVMIFGSMSTPDAPPTSAPRMPPVPQAPTVPTPVEFTIKVAVTEQTCTPDGNCTYKYTIEPKYIGLHPLPDKPFTVFYEVRGGHQPQQGEFTVQQDQAKISKDVVLDGPPNAQLTVTVTRVVG